MIYKVIEDKKWEYKTVVIDNYGISHNQLDASLDGDEGWECFAVVPYRDKMRFFLKRSYIEKIVNDEEDE